MKPVLVDIFHNKSGSLFQQMESVQNKCENYVLLLIIFIYVVYRPRLNKKLSICYSKNTQNGRFDRCRRLSEIQLLSCDCTYCKPLYPIKLVKLTRYYFRSSNLNPAIERKERFQMKARKTRTLSP